MRWLAWWAVVVVAVRGYVLTSGDRTVEEWRGCVPMWSQADIGGGAGEQARVEVRLWGSYDATTLLVHEFSDRVFLLDGTTTGGLERCVDEAIERRLCNGTTDRDRFLVAPVDMPVPSRSLYAHILNTVLPPNNSSIVYNVSRKGYYCIRALAVRDQPFSLRLDIVNPYGLLPAEFYPYLPFNGLLSLLFLGIGIAWIVKSFMHWRDILPVQNYIAVVIFILMLEHAFNYGYYDSWNKYGEDSPALMTVTVILNSLRNAVSLFTLLIVSLGYGVVYPSLGKAVMRKCIVLTVFFFITNVIYTSGRHQPPEERVSAWSFFVYVVPFSCCIMVFYTWTLSSLEKTRKHLESRRQTYKIWMYTWLWRVLALSLTICMLFSAITMWLVTKAVSIEWYSKNWYSIWFLQDGWMTIMYLVTFTAILILWRPTSQNVRYGLEELPDTDDAYDLEMSATGHRQASTRRGYGPDASDESLNQDTRPVDASASTVYDLNESDDDDEYQDAAESERKK